METYNVVFTTPDVSIGEQEGEVIFINEVAIGISVDYDYCGDDDEDIPEKPIYKATHLETGCLICKEIETKEKAIGIATQRITAPYWVDSINKCIERLKAININYPVNDIQKFKK